MSSSCPNASPNRSGRLLYIEDNPVNVLVVEELLASRPALTLACEIDGTRGLSRARSMLPDLILLDMQLPDFDGHEVLARLRADPDALVAAIPCIALSANGMPDDIRRAVAAGFLAYWTKPIDFKTFLQGLDEFFAAVRP
ncbi:response regulator [Roseateles sp.]|uniref:response regulator n=1 Tax=Roseateles sp. TaxID=1971397 RepID=UPI00286B14E4|nr:response regulator [Roseateles sp.]